MADCRLPMGGSSISKLKYKPETQPQTTTKMIYFDYLESPIGQLLVVANDTSLTGLYLENHKGGPSVGVNWKQDPPRFNRVREEIAAYFEGQLKNFDLPVSLNGTEFQKSVWSELRAIPFGETVTYGSIAKKLGLHRA